LAQVVAAYSPDVSFAKREEFWMKILPIGVGLLVGLLALVLIAVSEVTAVVLSRVQDLVMMLGAARKSANTRARSSRDRQVQKLPNEASRVEEVRPAA
jgi:hypothetical protein